MDIRHKSVADLTDKEYRACLRANYGDGGYMYSELQRCRMENFSGETIMLWNNHQMIGWALLTPVRTYGLVGVTRHGMKVSKYTAQFWVNERYRKKGYGKMLMHEVKKMDPRPHVIPHDDASMELFSSYRVFALAEDRFFLKPNKPKVA